MIVKKEPVVKEVKPRKTKTESEPTLGTDSLETIPEQVPMTPEPVMKAEMTNTLQGVVNHANAWYVVTLPFNFEQKVFGELTVEKMDDRLYANERFKLLAIETKNIS